MNARSLLLLALLPLAACAGPRPYAPVADVRYNALGAEPFWLLAIGDDRIVLTKAGENGRMVEAVYPRVMARREAGAQIWESGEGVQVIGIEARRSRCEGARGIVYEDKVRIRLSGAELHGCGGRILEGGRAR
ncbi:MAG TPA: hypothetical protein VF552_04270 [Allosphingosinicella sp.]|jgi:uncharacterized membrane protein